MKRRPLKFSVLRHTWHRNNSLARARRFAATSTRLDWVAHSSHAKTMGCGDRRGAGRLVAVIALLLFVESILFEHHVATSWELALLIGAFQCSALRRMCEQSVDPPTRERAETLSGHQEPILGYAEIVRCAKLGRKPWPILAGREMDCICQTTSLPHDAVSAVIDKGFSV